MIGVAPYAAAEHTWVSFGAPETSGNTWMYSLGFLCVAGCVAKKVFTACLFLGVCVPCP